MRSADSSVLCIHTSWLVRELTKVRKDRHTTQGLGTGTRYFVLSHWHGLPLLSYFYCICATEYVGGRGQLWV